MPKADVLRKLEFGGATHLVEDLSPEIQNLVAVYNEWSQDLVDARKEASQKEAAVQMVHNQLAQQISTELAKQKADEEAKSALSAEAVEGGLVDPADGEPLIDTVTEE